MKEKFITVKQAAEILSVRPNTLYQWKWQRKNLPFVKVGKALRVSETDLGKFLANNRIEIKDE